MQQQDSHEIRVQEDQPNDADPFATHGLLRYQPGLFIAQMTLQSCRITSNLTVSFSIECTSPPSSS